MTVVGPGADPGDIWHGGSDYCRKRAREYIRDGAEFGGGAPAIRLAEAQHAGGPCDWCHQVMVDAGRCPHSDLRSGR